MKSLLSFQKMDAETRKSELKTLTTGTMNARKEISKILLAGIIAKDFTQGEMNTYAQKATGVELRREVQGTYEAVNVIQAIHEDRIAMTEKEFDSKKFGSFPLIMLSGFLSKSPEKVNRALEIIRAGKDVTKLLKELRGGKAKPESKETESSESETGETELSEIQTIPGQSFFIPEGVSILNEPTLLKALVDEIAAAKSEEDCLAYLQLFADLSARVESRAEVLEAETAQTPAEIAA